MLYVANGELPSPLAACAGAAVNGTVSRAATALRTASTAVIDRRDRNRVLVVRRVPRVRGRLSLLNDQASPSTPAPGGAGDCQGRRLPVAASCCRTGSGAGPRPPRSAVERVVHGPSNELSPARRPEETEDRAHSVQGPIDIRLEHQAPDVLRLDASAI